MFAVLQKFVSDFREAEEPKKFIHSRMQLAEAALMYHVIAVDGVVRDDEKTRIQEVIASHFNLDEAEANRLVSDAKDAENEAIDLYQFTTLLKQALEHKDCVKIIEHLWEMVFADGVVHELEDNVVWRVAELLGVESRERMELKKKVWRRTQEAGD